MARHSISPASKRLKFEPCTVATKYVVPRARHRTPRSGRCACIAPAAPLTIARASLNLMSSSPSCQDSVSVDVFNVRAVLPVVASKFSAIAVRVLRWNGAAESGALNGVCRDVFMPSIVFLNVFFLKESSANNESASFH